MKDTEPTNGRRRQPGPQSYEVGVREWLEAAPPGRGKTAAAFDTRFDKPRWMTGSAAVRISRELGRLGYQMAKQPESFFVLHTGGPLKEGEQERAKRWGSELAQAFATRS